ncbi:MAG: ribbon-helix-helix protein, CopG family [Bacteroidota bacterium]
MFSIRLDEYYAERLRALAYWRRVSQREIVEQALDAFFADVEERKLHTAVEKFRRKIG